MCCQLVNLTCVKFDSMLSRLSLIKGVPGRPFPNVLVTSVKKTKNPKENFKKISKKLKKLKFSMKSLTFSCVICTLNLYFAHTFYSERQNLFKVAISRTAKSWSKCQTLKKLLKSCRAKSGKA